MSDDEREAEIRAHAKWRSKHWPHSESYDQFLVRRLDEARLRLSGAEADAANLREEAERQNARAARFKEDRDYLDAEIARLRAHRASGADAMAAACVELLIVELEVSREWATGYWHDIRDKPHIAHDAPITCDACVREEYQAKAKGIARALEQSAALAREQATEDVCEFIMAGHFLHDDAPTKRFAREVVAGIRRALSSQPPDTATASCPGLTR